METVKQHQQQMKKRYMAPHLIVHGSLEEITKSGQVNRNENGGHPSGKN